MAKSFQCFPCLCLFDDLIYSFSTLGWKKKNTNKAGCLLLIPHHKIKSLILEVAIEKKIIKIRMESVQTQ